MRTIARDIRFLTTTALVALALFARGTPAHADCSGPAECCITDPAHATVPLPEHVQLGVRIMQISAISEHDGNFTGEITLLMHWPAGGLRPDLSARNATAGTTATVDETTVANGTCFRERRLSGSFQAWFRLRRFPFDVQSLRLQFEDRSYTDQQVLYAPSLWPNAISIEAFRELSSWRFTDLPTLHITRSSFGYSPVSVRPRLVVIGVPVKRLWEFYLSRYFLPLFLIVALAYGLFWIKPDDLGSAASIGITCMLAIIAFQLAQADTLPRVAYLTMADRIYMVCYIATSVALGLAVWESHIAARGRMDEAHALDRRLRRYFPVAFLLSVGVAAWVGWVAQGDPNRDIPNLIAPAPAPPGDPALHSSS